MHLKSKAGRGEGVWIKIKWVSLHFYSDCIYFKYFNRTSSNTYFQMTKIRFVKEPNIYVYLKLYKKNYFKKNDSSGEKRW